MAKRRGRPPRKRHDPEVLVGRESASAVRVSKRELHKSSNKNPLENKEGIDQIYYMILPLPDDSRDMGRSRGNFHSNDEDPTQRSRRKKNVSNENSESAAAGQGPGEGKKALYHCNYCNKDITGRIRIKCVVCPDFDLCIECFSVGAEVTPHKSNHHYRVMDNLAFPLICPDWNADDEILLLEGIEMYGFWNWAEVAEHVGTKTREQCIDHYTNVYLNSPYFPLPDMSHVVGKNRKELLAMAKGPGEDKKGSCVLGDVKEESPFSPSRVKIEDTHKGGSAGGPNARTPSSIKPIIKRWPVINAHKGKGSKGKKPKSSGTEGPSLLELSGFNIKRQEFDPEYDNDAEQLLAEMEFKDNDTDDERDLKLRVLHIYSKRLDERKRRKDFILDRNLLYPNPFEENLSAEERALCRKYDIFMRFHTKEEHEQLLDSVIQEYRGLKRMQELKEAQAAGCRTSAEADRYWEIKRRQEAQDASRKKRESSQVGLNAFVGSGFAGKDSNLRPGGQPSSSHVHGFDIMGFNETQLLSEAEKRLCCELRLAPPMYLKMQEAISVEVFSGNIQKKSDVHHLFNIDTSKVDRVYDMLVKKGLAPP